MSTDQTVRRLQQSLIEAHGGEPYAWDLARAAEIVDEVEALKRLQAELRRAFAGDELDGGWKTALEHPIYLKADARITNLHEELKGLI